MAWRLLQYGQFPKKKVPAIYRGLFEDFRCISEFLFIYYNFFAEHPTMFVGSVVGKHWFILS
jgi:hypothetical protein